MRNFIIPNSNNNFHPYFLRTGFLSLVVVLILIGNILFSALGLVTINAYVDSSSIYRLHNQERSNNSLNELTVNPLLVESATKKAEAMMKSDCWSHYCPDGKSPWDFFASAGYDYIYAGENLGEGFSENETLMSAWMNSPTHRENILNSKFSEIGIGFATGDYQGIKNNTIVVVHFGTSVSESVKAVVTSNPIELDTTPPSVGIENFSISLLTIGGPDRYSVVYTNNDVSNFEVAEGYEFQKIAKNSWEITIPKSNADNILSIETKSRDLAENETRFEIPFKQLLSQLKNVDISNGNSTINVFTSFTRGIASNPKTNLNVSMMIFLTGLFGIDFYILEKSGQTNIRHTNRHILLVLIIISLILLIVTSASGQVLEGVTF
jgi:hypothetical protein